MITNGPGAHQRKKMNILGLTPFFHPRLILVSDEVGVAKPDPGIFEQAQNRVGYPPDQLLYVGDSWTNDVMAPIRAGWHTVWFNHRKKKAESHHKPLLEVARLDSILPLFNTMRVG
ncbi:FMN phosphatase YigB (HAD superfamily) [Caldalkalibacillus uzonensis]|uniref:FMN phosphatase YigB (HAD superfamily) n=1 Tax=Caldalkalibacillus uzonensis TaxID=353224 RepID=A0ABU0CUD0_9BACI|nr:FMN phosphatase YigB (HAD superfamily) [Caldalkalibacillus uzonensis]